MVKNLILVFIFLSAIFADQNKVISTVQRLIEPKEFQKHQRLIRRIFNQEERYLSSTNKQNVDVIEIIQRLKNDGLFKLNLGKAKNLEITFKGSGYPLFFVKLISDSLQSIGYYRYIVQEAKQEIVGFSWTISINSEYIIDPIVLNNALIKQDCKILDIERKSSTKWEYTLDTEQGTLDVPKLKLREEESLQKPITDYWLNISNGVKIEIESKSHSNSWYPYISFFDKELHLLKVYKRDKITKKINLPFPKHSKYIRISDVYHLENISAGLDIILK